MSYTKEDVLRMVEEEDVEFIRLQFTDLLGNLKNIAVTAGQLAHVLDAGCKFDAAAVDPFIKSKGSERLLRPDYDTFEIFPWRPQQDRVARLLCDVCMPDGAPCDGDPRALLRRAAARAERLGYTFRVGPECEFFLFETDENANPTTVTHEQAGYFDVGPLDGGENARRDLVMTLEDMGIAVDASHHEAAPAQHELDLAHDEALRTADNIITFKLAARTIGKRHGLHATFMPKPKFGVNGSGMHINMSLHRDGANIFGDAADPLGLSQEAYWFIGGLLRHMRAIAAVTNPLVNSYKRLVPGYEAPVYIAWSSEYRNQLLRVPPVMQGNGTRLELRSPDSACNPYLTLALCLHAGLDGIENKMVPPRAVDEDLTEMSDAEREALGVGRLPETLIEAVAEFERDAFVREVLGESLTARYAALKRREWNDYQIQVSEWELNEYLKRY